MHHGHGDHGSTVVLEVSGLRFATEGAVVERLLGARPGVVAVDANPVAQTATVTYDPAVTSVADLRGWVRECGYHCAGRSVPNHLCDAMAEPAHDGHAGHEATTGGRIAARGDGPRRARRDVDGRHGPRHAEPVPGRRAALDRDPAVVADRTRRARVRRPGPVRAPRRRVDAAAEPAGDRLLGLDLLRRRGAGAPRQDARHDGARRRRDRHRLVLLGRRHAHRRRRGLLRGGHGARRVRAPRPLVRDAGARRRERRDPHAPRPVAADGARRARRPRGRGPHRGGRPRRRPRRSAPARRSPWTPPSSRGGARSTSRWSPARACRCRKARATS